MSNIIGVRFKDGGKTYYFDPADLEIKKGDKVIVETARGIEFGDVTIPVMGIDDESITAPLKSVIRIATPEDEKQAKANRRKEDEALKICEEKVEKHGLEMKLIRCEYTFDGSKILFYFTANGRVDFRELVKDLAAIFKTRIELRQVGVRDKAKMLSGIGICGRPFCCSSFLKDFQPVSIKMAKEQSLSLNPTKISGSCGRLMCCLKYEQNTYDELLKVVPREGAIVKTPEGKGIVVSASMFKGKVKVKLDHEDENVLKEFPVSEIKILKNVKVKEEEIDESLKELE